MAQLTIEQLQEKLSELTETIQKQKDDLKAAQDEAAAFKSRFEAGINERQEIKDKIRQELEKKGEYEQVIKDLKLELNKLKSDFTELQTTNATLVKSNEEYEKNIRETYLNMLDESKREKYKSHPISVLKDIVEDFGNIENANVNVHRGKPNNFPDVSTLSWKDMSTEQRRIFQQTHSQDELSKKIAESLH
jgi:chromosome segregation ATPase